jgi:hypothetical protein
MRKNVLLMAVLILGAVALSILCRRHGPAARRSPGWSNGGRGNIGLGGSPGARHAQLAGAAVGLEASPSLPADIEQETEAYIQRLRDDPQYDWKRPISFYGRVLDDSGQPVPGADVHFEWNSLDSSGEMVREEARTTSDADGRFSLLGKTGKRLFVDVLKEGYYGEPTNRVAFEYAVPYEGLFLPQRDRPVTFGLRKKGPGAELITSQRGVRPDLGVRAPRDGTPVRVDLLSRKVGEAGQLEISQAKPEYEHWRQATEWTFRMAIPDGGFVEYHGEFPFQAPEAGYQPTVEFRFSSRETNWAATLQKQYYIAFGQPRLYGRLLVETTIEMQGARLTYAVNPDGSRCLEPK